MPTTLYHHPGCSKSRKALAILQEHGLTPRVVEYLRTPLDRAELIQLLDLLGLEPHQLLRTGEALYAELGLKDRAIDREEGLQLLLDHPVLQERPILVHGGRAVVARPPERVLELLR